MTDYFEQRVLREQKVVDAAYYFRNHTEIIDSGMSAVRHYVLIGAQEGLNPNENFNSLEYLVANPEVQFSAINPLVHYVQTRK